jgi:hypothetical protein
VVVADRNQIFMPPRRLVTTGDGDLESERLLIDMARKFQVERLVTLNNT